MVKSVKLLLSSVACVAFVIIAGLLFFKKISPTPDWYNGQKYARDCPSADQALPPSLILNQDFVELSRSACMGTCPEYVVRIAENGNVSWQGLSFVDAVGKRQSNIGRESAHALLKQFQSPSFWALCGLYSVTAADYATTRIQVQIGGRSKTLTNFANSAPEWVESQENAIDATANTHFWRHGQPPTEALHNIREDAYMSKPGVTPLMKAAGKTDVGSIKKILTSGADVDATDASGWTALMYAAASSHPEAVQLFLASGANPNHKSLKGDTPLMASNTLDKNLVHAGAQVNSQNAAGTTILMILAAGGHPDEVKDALNAGADATLKDVQGRTALDYVQLASCGKSPVPRFANPPCTVGEQCNCLDEDNLRQIATLLKTAERNPTKF